MARVKRGYKARQRRKRVLRHARGFFGSRSRLYRVAKIAVMHAWRDAYIGRRLRKRDMRRLWIARINAAAREQGLSYSRFLHGLKTAGVEVDRKMLADMAVHDSAAFAELVTVARQAVEA